MRAMKMLFRVGTLALGAILAVLPAPASAQTDEERAGARAAGLAGLEAYQAGKYDQAVDYFGRAESLMHAPTHLLYLARGNAKLGHLVSAREYYLKLTQERLSASASKPFRDAQAAGDKELNELEPRLPYVSVVVQGTGAKDVQVTRDGERIPQPLLGVPHPEDPGTHTFKAVAESMESAASTVTLKEGAHETVLLTLSPTEAPAAAARPSTKTGTAGFGSDAPPNTDQPTSHGNGLRVAGFVVGGVGIVGLGVGTVFLLKSSSSRDKANTLYAACRAAHTCDQPEFGDPVNAADSDANSQRTVGAVSMIAGGAALTTGLILLIVDASSSHSSASSRVQPMFGLNYAGLSGRF